MVHQPAETKQNERETKFTRAFSTFSANDIQEAKKFYAETLGVEVAEEEEGLRLTFGSTEIFVYPKDDHKAANFTVLNLQVDDIDNAVDYLTGRGVKFESYSGEMETDPKGIFRGGETGDGPNIAWFKDPAGNILSVMEEK